MWARSFRRLIPISLSLALAAVAVPTAAQAAPTTFAIDGKTAATAAASCWEIKQLNASAKDGIYWLQTPALVAPEQFYCDMTTDGGGWVLVGRGREGWKYYAEGQGTPAQVRDVITGTAAFSPRQLSTDVINALLNNGSLDDLDDGIRVRRATNINGTSWQEARFKYQKNKTKGWTWAIGGKIPIASWKFDSKTGTGGDTASGFGQSGFLGIGAANRIESSIQDSSTSYYAGFGFKVGGRNDSTSYIWSKSWNSKPGLPFSQVYLRPKLTTGAMKYDAAQEKALAAQPMPPMMEDRVLTGEWGVTGLANGDQGEASIEVAAFAQVGDQMFAGGNFTTVLKNNNAATGVKQQYLAAFDVKTGEFNPSFRPTFNGQVKALTKLPNGLLLVGGEFTKVNGESISALVALDPMTGEINRDYNIGVHLGTNTKDLKVRSFAVQGNWLYISGRFSQMWGGTRDRDQSVAAGNAGRVNINTGQPDYQWNPTLTGTGIDIYASERGDRVYIAGVFGKSMGASNTSRAVALTAAPGVPSVIPWTKAYTYGTSGDYQQAVIESGDKVFLGGAQHSVLTFDRATLKQTNSVITLQGGDFQAATHHKGVVYVGNHGDHYVYENANWYSSSASSIGPWTEVYKFSFTGAWSPETGKYVPAFDPMLKARRGNGTWALTVDSNGTMWMGGDFTSGVNASGKSQWTGGFMRFASRDDVAPSVPGGVAVAADGTITWNASTDDRAGAVSYEVLVNGRVRGVTTARQLQLAVGSDDLVQVRGIDSTGNRSATLNAVAPGQGVQPGADELIVSGGTWLHQEGAVPAAWSGTDTPAGANPVRTPAGYGSDLVTSTIQVGATRPLAHAFRTTFNLDNFDGIDVVKFKIIADDGAAVWVNGHEISRTRLPEGALTDATYATASVRTNAAQAAPRYVYVPTSYLVQGTNVVTAQTHLNYRTSADMSFDLEATTLADRGNNEVLPDPGAGEQSLVIKASDTWQYRYTNDDVPSGWADTGFVAGNQFTTGAAPLGYGTTGLNTTLSTNEATKPLTAYFRNEFTLDNPAQLELSTWADDGAAIYVNGTEVSRTRLPEGNLTGKTYATAAVKSSAAQADPVTFTIPANLLKVGTNVITAEVHVNYRNSVDMSFSLTASIK